MGAERTAWHVVFGDLLSERAPPGIKVTPEHVLTNEPQRADYLLLRRRAGRRRDEKAKVLRGLWPRLAKDTLVELKSPTCLLRRGGWIKLLGYGAQHQAAQIRRLPQPSDLTLVLAVPTITPTLRREAKAMGWQMRPLGDGYWEILGNIRAMWPC